MKKSILKSMKSMKNMKKSKKTMTLRLSKNKDTRRKEERLKKTTRLDGK